LRQQLRPIVRELRYRKDAVTELWSESDFASPSELTRAVKRAYGFSPRDIKNGARPCLNPSRRERFSRRARFARGLRPAGCREPEIICLGSLRLAYRRTFRPMTGGNPQQDLIDVLHWAASKGLPLFPAWGLVGICHDDFDLDPFRHFSYESAVVLPDRFQEPLPPGMGLYCQPAGTYAAIRVEGDLEAEEDAGDYFYSGWLPRSGYRLGRGAGLEVFLDESGVYDWSRLRLNLLFPIKRR